MPWHCPACSSIIRHNEHEAVPNRGVVYRCHVCRLEWIVDAVTDKLTVAPMPEDSHNDRSPHSLGTRPPR
jgi:hypothetical protein